MLTVSSDVLINDWKEISGYMTEISSLFIWPKHFLWFISLHAKTQSSPVSVCRRRNRVIGFSFVFTLCRARSRLDPARWAGGKMPGLIQCTETHVGWSFHAPVKRKRLIAWWNTDHVFIREAFRMHNDEPPGSEASSAFSTSVTLITQHKYSHGVDSKLQLTLSAKMKSQFVSGSHVLSGTQEPV